MLSEIIENQKLELFDFKPFAKASDRDAWNFLNETWKNECIELGKTYKGFSFYGLNATEFMELSINGNRTNYENRLFEKRKALSALVIAECIEYRGEYISDIINGIFSICEESAWFLPAHNTYIRDAVQLPLPDAINPVLELFSCETGAILATAMYLLEDELNKVSPFIAKRIRYELNHRIFEPYLNCHFWWMGEGDERMCNWTIWCTQNVLISAFLYNASDNGSSVNNSSDGSTIDNNNLSNDTLEKIIFKAAKSTDYYLKDFGEDGCCDEGAQYYRHSALCLYNVLDILNCVLNGTYDELYSNPKIINMAIYIMNMHVAGPYYFNFADCSPVAGRSGAREFLFAKAINNPEMMRYAATDFFDGPVSSRDENNLYYRVQSGFAANEMLKFVGSSSATHTNELYYESTGMFITGDGYFSLAVKGGNNGESHNHNDTGSFTVYAKGEPMIIDIGVESYTKKTFSDKRYEIWTMQSAFHNLPTIDGIMQKDGLEFSAKDISYEFSDTVSSISMDISDAYPLNDTLKSYIRKVTLNKGKNITVHDIIDSSYSPDKIVLSLMTYEKPELLDNGSLGVGNLGTISFTGCSLTSIEEHPITDPRLAITWKHSIYRTLLTYNESEISITLNSL